MNKSRAKQANSASRPEAPISAHWGIPDPAAVRASEEIALAFAEAYCQLYNRISALVNLPISSLYRVALQGKLDEIGRIEDDAG